MDFKASDDKALLTALILNNLELSAQRILQIYGLSKALAVMDARELRGMFSKKSQRSWQRIMAEANQIKLPDAQSPLWVIKRHLRVFRPLKLKKS